MGIWRSRQSTCSVRLRQSLKVMPSFSARARTAAHTWSLMLLRVVSVSLRKAASRQSYSSWWLYITLCISFQVASALEQRWWVMASHSASVMSSCRIAEYVASRVERPRVSISCAVPWIELQCMASSPDST